MVTTRPASRDSPSAAGTDGGNFQAAKEGWLKVVASHPNLAGADYAVAIFIASYLNSKTRVAWPSLEQLAQDTNRVPSTVWRSIERLEQFELLDVQRARGRTKSHRYRPRMGALDRDPKTLRRRRKNTANSQSKHCGPAGRTSEEG